MSHISFNTAAADGGKTYQDIVIPVQNKPTDVQCKFTDWFIYECNNDSIWVNSFYKIVMKLGSFR